MAVFGHGGPPSHSNTSLQLKNCATDVCAMTGTPLHCAAVTPACSNRIRNRRGGPRAAADEGQCRPPQRHLLYAFSDGCLQFCSVTKQDPIHSDMLHAARGASSDRRQQLPEKNAACTPPHRTPLLHHASIHPSIHCLKPKKASSSAPARHWPWHQHAAHCAVQLLLQRHQNRGGQHSLQQLDPHACAGAVQQRCAVRMRQRRQTTSRWCEIQRQGPRKHAHKGWVGGERREVQTRAHLYKSLPAPRQPACAESRPARLCTASVRACAD